MFKCYENCSKYSQNCLNCSRNCKSVEKIYQNIENWINNFCLWFLNSQLKHYSLPPTSAWTFLKKKTPLKTNEVYTNKCQPIFHNFPINFKFDRINLDFRSKEHFRFWRMCWNGWAYNPRIHFQSSPPRLPKKHVDQQTNLQVNVFK